MFHALFFFVGMRCVVSAHAIQRPLSSNRASIVCYVSVQLHINRAFRCIITDRSIANHLFAHLAEGKHNSLIFRRMQNSCENRTEMPRLEFPHFRSILAKVLYKILIQKNGRGSLAL